MKNLIIFFLILFIVLWAIDKEKYNKQSVTFLTEYGKGNLEKFLLDKKVQISFLDKTGQVNYHGKVEDFIHPGLANRKYKIESIKEMIDILKSFPDGFVDVIYFGTHGKAGKSILPDERNIMTDLTNEEKNIIKSKMRRSEISYFVLTGCSIGKNPQAVIKFSKDIRTSVIAPTANTDNDEKVSLWTEGVWMVFWY